MITAAATNMNNAPAAPAKNARTLELDTNIDPLSRTGFECNQEWLSAPTTPASTNSVYDTKALFFPPVIKKNA